MDFGTILDEWDRRAVKAPVRGLYDKDRELRQSVESSGDRRRRLLRKSPDAVIDLHGLTQEEAWESLDLFFGDAKRRGLEKVLVIHGKGNHTGSPGAALSSTGVLKRVVRDFIERCPFAGENGFGSAASGGSGATWVLLKS
ncbi:hypothetical protein FACS189468_2420 [Spirochaetia bacterium]|nr:hypothetical protein FACS189468_2420 [Spirochaetia bacterium]